MPAESLARALGGRKAGKDWMARCPAHDDREPSLSVRDTEDGKVLVHCHAGCEQSRVIDALGLRGLWKPSSGTTIRLVRSELRDQRAQSHFHEAKRTDVALAIWRSAKPAGGTLVQTYLRSRALRVPPPATLRFHDGLRHPDGTVWPAMVSLIARGADGIPIAIHRTFLATDGFGKAPVKTQKMMLGPCRGGAVRLAVPSNMLMVGEGIETCLAAMQATGLPAWAGLSTAGLRALDLPSGVREVIVLADGDDAGEEAALECAQRWRREGRRVCIARPPPGTDFNDLLIGSPSAEGSTRHES